MTRTIQILLLFACSAVLQAQQVRPLATMLDESSKDAKKKALGIEVAYVASLSHVSGSRCTGGTTPSVTNSYSYSHAVYTASQAASLRIPFVSAEGASTQHVYVRDYKAGALCPAADGTGEVLYGHTIRTIVSLETFDAAAGLDIYTLAAKATLNRSRQSFDIKIYGMSNPKFNMLLARIANVNFDVQGISEYQAVMESLIRLISDSATSFTPAEIGFVPAPARVTRDDASRAVAMSFALTRLKDGRDCRSAQAELAQVLRPFSSAVIDAYSVVMGSCTDNPPGQTARNTASNLLAGYETKR